MIWSTSRIGAIRARARSFFAMRIPIGIPSATATMTAASVTASVCMVGSQRPNAPTTAKPLSASTPVFQPPAA